MNVQKLDMDAYMKERERIKTYKILEMIKNREDPNGRRSARGMSRHLFSTLLPIDSFSHLCFFPIMPNLLCDSSMLSHSRGECTIKVDRVQKPERGNSTIRYHALVIGGNGIGAAGALARHCPPMRPSSRPASIAIATSSTLTGTSTLD
jgi:hypothetical protein